MIATSGAAREVRSPALASAHATSGYRMMFVRQRCHGRGARAAGRAVAAVRAHLVALTLLAAVSAKAAGEPPHWPQRPLKIVAAQQSGGATDNVARIIAEALEKELGVAVTVENRPGAGGKIGAEAVARSAPDGYTLLVGGTSNLVIGPAVEPDVRYDPAHDFAPIGRVAHVPFGFAVNAAVPAHTLKELAALARARPGGLTYVSLGPATTTGFGTSMFLREAGVDMLAIEYRGIATAIPDVLGGRVDLVFNEVALLAQNAAGGHLRALAIASPRRSPRLPDVPTTAEQGFPRVVMSAWYGLVAPSGIPPEAQKRLLEAYRAIARSPVVRARIESLGYEPIDESPAQFAAAMREEAAMVRGLTVKAPGPGTR